MVQWHHWLNGHEFQQTPGDNEGVMQSMGLQRVGHDLMTEQQQHVLSQERNTGSLIQVLYSFPWFPPLCRGLCQICFMKWHNVHSYQYDLHAWSCLTLKNVFSLLQVFKPPKNFYYCCNILVIEILSHDSHLEKALSNHYSVSGNTPNVDIS